MEKNKKQQPRSLSESSAETALRTTMCSIHDATVPILSSIRKTFPGRCGLSGGGQNKSEKYRGIMVAYFNDFITFPQLFIVFSL